VILSTKKDQKVFYLVINVKTNELIYCASEKYECENHINDAIYREVEQACKWVVRKAAIIN